MVRNRSCYRIHIPRAPPENRCRRRHWSKARRKAEWRFQPADLNDKDVVIVAVNDKSVSNYVRVLAKEKKILVNVADTPDQCDFYLGSIVTKGNLKLAISTNGKSPTVAKRLKEVFHELLPDELEEVLDNLQQIRNKLKGDFANKVQQLNELTKVLISENKQPQ